MRMTQLYWSSMSQIKAWWSERKAGKKKIKEHLPKTILGKEAQKEAQENKKPAWFVQEEEIEERKEEFENQTYVKESFHEKVQWIMQGKVIEVRYLLAVINLWNLWQILNLSTFLILWSYSGGRVGQEMYQAVSNRKIHNCRGLNWWKKCRIANRNNGKFLFNCYGTGFLCYWISFTLLNHRSTNFNAYAYLHCNVPSDSQSGEEQGNRHSESCVCN